MISLALLGFFIFFTVGSVGGFLGAVLAVRVLNIKIRGRTVIDRLGGIKND